MSSIRGGRSSVFELMLSPRVRVARIAVVLVIDAALAAAGIVMIRNWMAAAARVSTPAPVLAAAPPPAPVRSQAAAATSTPKPRAPHPVHTPAPPPTPPSVQPVVEPVVTPLVPDAGIPALVVVVTGPPDAAPAPPPDSPVDPARVDKVSAGIRYVVELHRDQIEECYRRAAKATTTTDPLSGRLEVHLRLTPSGEAEDVRVQDNGTGSEPLGACLVALMSAWRYPSPGEPMDFVWPFTFQGH